MRIRTLVSPLALAVGLAMTGAASAQVTIGGQTVLEEDMPAVQQRCDELALAARTGAGDTDTTQSDDQDDDAGDDTGDDTDNGTDNGTDDGSDDTGTDDTTTSDANGDFGTADEVDNALTGVELNSITLDQCIEAGLVEGPLPLSN